MNSDKPCRHEFVIKFQRKLKGLERRLVATPIYLPVGFKTADFSHLGENSYCFCKSCRARLYPKRTNAEKAQARVALALGKQQALEAESAVDDTADEGTTTADISVEELELESLELEDLQDGTVTIPPDEGTCQLTGDE
jgi:hypothetical protein